MLWEISQNSQENICARISFLVFSCEFCEICKNTFFTKKFQWLLLRFNSCFQRNSDQKPVRLSAINTRFRFCCYCFFFLTHDIFILKKLFHNTHQVRCYHFSSLRLLLKVWIWYRCQNRIENCHHDGQQLGFYKKAHMKAQNKKNDVLVTLYCKQTKRRIRNEEF